MDDFFREFRNKRLSKEFRNQAIASLDCSTKKTCAFLEQCAICAVGKNCCDCVQPLKDCALKLKGLDISDI